MGVRRRFVGILGCYRDLKIKQKLLISYFVLIVIPLILVSVLFYSRSASTIETSLLEVNNLAIKQASSALSQKFGNMIKVSEMIIYNSDVQEILIKDISAYSLIEQIEDEKRLGLFLLNAQNDEDIFRVRFYVDGRLIYSREKNNFFDLEALANAAWRKGVQEKEGRVLWLPTYSYDYLGVGERRVISAARTVRNYTVTGGSYAILLIDILEKEVADVLKKNSITERGQMFLVDGNGRMLSGSSSLSPSEEYELVRTSLSSFERPGKWIRIEGLGEKALACYQEIKYTDWKLITFIPLSDIFQESWNLGKYLILLIIVIGAFAYGLAYASSYSMMKRISSLAATMKQLQEGDFNTLVDVDGKDEIGDLEKSFNYMVKEISQLMEEMYKVGRKAKNAELRLLQAQINPHFLYNTLDLINWQAERYQAQDIQFLITSLAKFYKLSLSKGQAVVSIASELELVEAYVAIQNQRFRDCIRLVIDVPEGIRDCSILKLILQPLVENAILHGVLEKSDKKGTVVISGREEGHRIRLQVEDDGPGITDTLAKSLLDEDTKNDHGYGIQNVNERIKINFGEEYGLEFQARAGTGTIVSIFLPLLRSIG